MIEKQRFVRDHVWSDSAREMETDETNIAMIGLGTKTATHYWFMKFGGLAIGNESCKVALDTQIFVNGKPRGTGRGLSKE